MTSTHLIRFTQTLVLAAVVAAVAAPTVALAGSNPGKPAPDWFERYVAAHPYGHGVLDQTQAPDWFERYAASHGPAVPTDGRSPDTLDAAQATRLRLADGRSPDTLDAAGFAQTQVAPSQPSPVERIIWQEDGRRSDQRLGIGSSQQQPQTVRVVASGGFDWRDAGIGAGLATALIALLASSLLAFRVHRRHRIQTT